MLCVYVSDVVTCIASSAQNNVLVTGSRDTTVMIWHLQLDKSKPVLDRPTHVLYGHDDEVTCVAVSVDLDVRVAEYHRSQGERCC